MPWVYTGLIAMADDSLAMYVEASIGETTQGLATHRYELLDEPVKSKRNTQGRMSTRW